MFSVYAIENPLMDYLMRESYQWLERFDARPGTMQLVDYERFQAIVRASREHQVFPGGSGANTIRALAMMLGDEAATLGAPAYSGGIGRDEPGLAFCRILENLGVRVSVAEKDLPTGVSAIVITPDHERTMFTYLGACRDFSEDDVDLELLEASRMLYGTGYLWDSEPQMRALFKAVDFAKSRRIPVCFDLADPFVVDRYYEGLREWLPGKVQVLFANRRELARMTDCGPTDPDIVILQRAAALAPVVAMKIGKGGCIIQDYGRVLHVPGESVNCRDTTGAGDSFAAGYLYGVIKGLDARSCGVLGNRIASRIVTIEGCRYDLLDRDDLLAPLA
jgi:fructokinase